MDHFDLVTKWGRGLSRDVCEKYRIGFIEFGKTQFAPWQKAMEIPAAWVLPITNEDNVLKGVKTHFEERPYWGGKECPKNLWLPFGTVPAYKQEPMPDGKICEIKPVHSYYTMWPHPATVRQHILDDFSLDASFWIARIPENMKPEWNMLVEAFKYKIADEQSKSADDLDGPAIWDANLRAFDEMKQKLFKVILKKTNESDEVSGKSRSVDDWSDYIFICPGELKALACESAGMMATAITGGEAWMPGPDFLSKFARKKVVLFADADTPKINENKKTGDKKLLCSGRDWVQKWSYALAMHGASHVVAKYGGQAER